MIYVVISITSNGVHSDIVSREEVQTTFMCHAAGYEDLIEGVMEEDNDPTDWFMEADDLQVYVSEPKYMTCKLKASNSQWK